MLLFAGFAVKMAAVPFHLWQPQAYSEAPGAGAAFLGAVSSRMGLFAMALVLVKLFLVDLGNSGTVERIVSFIGTGVLLLIVGYFAPVPPRGSAEPEQGTAE